MTKRQKFTLMYAPLTKSHLRTIDRKYYSLIRAAIENNLRHGPDVETTNRNPLKRQVYFEAEWALRVGPDNRFRVFYDIEMEARRVYILAIGEKERDCLFIGGKEIRL